MLRGLPLSLLLALSPAAFAQAPPPPPPAPASGSAPAPGPTSRPVALPSVTVPERSDAPVMTDGQFSPGEWDGAVRVALNEAVELLLRQHRGVVFLGIRGSGADTMVGPSGLFLSVPGGPIHLLHRSLQLGEVVLPAQGEAPPFRFGLTPDWYANEERRDEEAFKRLQGEGKTPFEIIRATTYPTEGMEFAIRRSKLAGTRWLLHLEVSAMVGNRPDWIVFPQGTVDRNTDAWLELKLE